jgi:hypothetical protein
VAAVGLVIALIRVIDPLGERGRCACAMADRHGFRVWMLTVLVVGMPAPVGAGI